jgi:glycosyltransferase involved in cell wall biosynthesis
VTITVLHVFSGDLWAGAEVMIHHLLCRLRADPAVRILALALNEGTLTAKLRECGIEVLVVPEEGASFPSIVQRSRRALRGRRIDLIHSHRLKENAVGFCLARLLGAGPLVATVHGLPEPGATAPGGKPGIRWPVRANFVLLRRAFRTVVAVSHEMRRELVGRYRVGAEKVVVIHNGIPLPGKEEEPPAGEQTLRVGSVGRLVAVKDYDLFLETAALLARGSRPVRFGILGDGPLLAQLRERAQALGIGALVEFGAPVTDPSPFYRSLDLYLSTSVHEGIPLSILEAMAAGRPVVAPRVGGIPEIITREDEGLLVPTRRPEDFAAACLALLDDPSRRRAMGDAGRARVRSAFSDAAMAAGYTGLYHTLLGD